ncbi:hypothetical protein BGX31_007142 [Mortierella sp. GBA43]|nr:hypothetical protein BGX31_007142 [Mortierella sp. GBA43]
MCILLWTLPNSNHPRFKFNRDEFLARETSRAEFWDLDSILQKANTANGGSTINSSSAASTTATTVGVLSGQDLQPSKAADYIIQETQKTTSGEEKLVLELSTEDVPGTWLGITTQGDLVALTNYRETKEYLAQQRPPKLSRGKVCGEYLITMAAAHQDKNSNMSSGSDETPSQAEHWLRKRAIGWEDEFEGLNLLVVQNGGDQQCIGGNREGCGVSMFRTTVKQDEHGNSTDSHTIAPGNVVGVSNSVFTRPWKKVEMGVEALEAALNKSLTLFGAESHATSPNIRSSLTSPPLSPGSPISKGDITENDSIELAWLVVELLTLLRTLTKPFPTEGRTAASVILGLRERVFVPRIGIDASNAEYGTRSSTVVLFGRDNRLAVYVEKVWYGPLDRTTGKRQEFAPDSSEGLVWWQGLVGEPKESWRKIEGEELESLLQSAKVPVQ